MFYWYEKKIVVGMLYMCCLMINVLFCWMGKNSLVNDVIIYLFEEIVCCSIICKVLKVWDSKYVDLLEIIQQVKKIDECFVVMIVLQYYFGLCVKESIEFCGDVEKESGVFFFLVQLGIKGGCFCYIFVEIDE